MPTPFEIGPLPLVKNPARREACRYDFRLFCETYLPYVFTRPIDGKEARTMDRLQELLFCDKPFADELDRGEGSTTLTIAATLYCGCYGHRPYVAVIVGCDIAAQTLISHTKDHLYENALLAEDFPEVTYPIACINRDSRLTAGQKCNGQPTRIVWRRHTIGFPCIAGADSRGFRVVAAALNGSLMGMAFTTDEGDHIRPAVLLLDDPVTNDVLASPTALALRVRRSKDLIGAYPAAGLLVGDHPYGHAFTRPQPATT